jgi:hypothetical protein
MSNWKYKYKDRVKRKLGIAEYLSLLNYILAYNSEKKSFSLTVKSSMRMMKNLLINSELYIKKKDRYESQSYFVDFDDREDHLNKIDKYVERLKLGSLSIKKTSDYIARSNRLKRLKVFFSLFFLALYISHVKKLNVFYVLEALAKFSQYHALGVSLAANIELENILSLNLQTSLGFVFGLKSIKPNIQVITIQHGFITKLNGRKSTKWRDYYSGYYICWSNLFKTIALSRFSGKCNIIVDGGVFDVEDYFKNLTLSRKNGKKSIVFLSSFSKYANEAIVDQEVKAICRLDELCSGSEFDFTVRLHPSIQFETSFLPARINVELPYKITLEDSISKASVICTISSSSIIASAKMKKDIMVLESVNDNILNLSLKTVDIYSNDCINQLVSNNTQKLDDLSFMFGVQTNKIESIPSLYL